MFGCGRQLQRNVKHITVREISPDELHESPVCILIGRQVKGFTLGGEKRLTMMVSGGPIFSKPLKSSSVRGATGRRLSPASVPTFTSRGSDPIS
jgi:hypothetical protein